VLLGFDLGEDRCNTPGFINQVGNPVGPQIFSPVETFLAPDTIRLDQSLLGIGEQGEWQIILLGERLMGFPIIDADAEDCDIELLKRAPVIAKGTSLLGAPGSVVFGIELEEYLLPLEIAQGNCLPILICCLEMWSLCANLQEIHRGAPFVTDLLVTDLRTIVSS
jgi:hypothetical protein